MFQLAIELREAHIQEKTAPLVAVMLPLFNNSYQNSIVDGSRKRKQSQVNVNCDQNKTAKFCCGCHRSVYGKCTGRGAGTSEGQGGAAFPKGTFNTVCTVITTNIAL